MSLFYLMYEHGNEGGLMKQSLFRDIMMPAFESAQFNWINVNINLGDYFHLSRNVDKVIGFVNLVHSIGPRYTPGLCMDFIQCTDCMSPCRWCSHNHSSDDEDGWTEEVVHGNACILKLRHPDGMDCVGVARAYVKIARACMIPACKLVIRGMDVSTLAGRAIYDCIMEVIYRLY